MHLRKKDQDPAWTAREDLMLLQLARRNTSLKVIALILGRSDESVFLRSIQLKANINLRQNQKLNISSPYGKAS
jgi:hypothetical protein